MSSVEINIDSGIKRLFGTALLVVGVCSGISPEPRPVYAENPKPTPAAGAAIPTATPTPQDVICIDGSCVDRAKLNQVIDKAVQVALDAEATKQAKNTPTPRPTFAPTPAVGAGSRGNEGGFPWAPWGPLAGGGLIAGGLLGVKASREKIVNGAKKGVRLVRSRFGETYDNYPLK